MILSAVLLASDLTFVAVNYWSAQRQFDTSMQEQAAQQAATFKLALELELDNLVKMAELVAGDPELRRLFQAGRDAVLREGGGPGGEAAAKAREALMDQIRLTWARLRDDFGMRQLHFHIGPGSLSFLRAHKPEKFGDRMDDVRHIIVDTNSDGKARRGFETGRVYSGLRGVVPMFAPAQPGGGPSQIGAVEVGASFDHLFEVMDRQLHSGIAALLQEGYVGSTMWPEQLKATFSILSDQCRCVVDAASRAEISEVLNHITPFPPFNDAKLLTTYAQLEGRKLAVTHLPLIDYLGERDGTNAPVGRIILWRDIELEDAVFTQGLQTVLLYALFGYLLVEFLLYWAIRLATDRLQRVIEGQTAALTKSREALRLEKERAEEANRAKSAFLANMSHELRTPLNAMLGYAQILLRDPAAGPEQQRQLKIIERSGDHLLTLINDVLDLAKVEAGRFTLTPKPFQPPQLMNQLADLFRMRAAEKGVAFGFREISPLPAWGVADETRLRQIVTNLLGNAVKFTEEGEVRLEAGFADGMLEVAVLDTGIGISPEKLPNLFEPFRQTGSARYRNQGTGLGLAISKSLATQMGGEVLIESEPGKGSRFLLRVPLPEPDQPTTASGAEHLGAVYGYRRTDGANGKFQLLLVDDLADNRDVLQGLLAPLGFDISEAADGAAALRNIELSRPDLVFMDLAMPVMNGLEATRRIHAMPGLESLPVVACSASAFVEDRENSRQAGCVDHLAKPVRVEALLATLARHLPLVWLRAAPASAPKEETTRERPLTQDQREQLMAMLRRGQIGEIRQYLESPALRADDNPLLDRLRELAVHFRIKELRALVDAEA